MDSLIDQVARQFARKNLEGCEAPHIEACDPKYCRCRFFAREAIAAMREPTDGMMWAGYNQYESERESIMGPAPVPMWRAMIDEALKMADSP